MSLTVHAQDPVLVRLHGTIPKTEYKKGLATRRHRFSRSPYIHAFFFDPLFILQPLAVNKHEYAKSDNGGTHTPESRFWLPIQYAVHRIVQH
jgi:hypothetical protein